MPAASSRRRSVPRIADADFQRIAERRDAEHLDDFAFKDPEFTQALDQSRIAADVPDLTPAQLGNRFSDVMGAAINEWANKDLTIAFAPKAQPAIADAKQAWAARLHALDAAA